MNNLPPTPPLPHPGDGATPAPVDRLDELLSAMVDGELTPAELLELEETAVATNSTVQEMAAPFHEGQALAADSVLGLRSPPPLRHQQLRNALAQLDQPEVASLTAARTTLATKQHHQRRRMQRLSSVAAALVIVAGIGIIGTQLGGSGSDSAASDEEGAASTLTRELSDDFAASGAAADDAASDDGAMTQMAEAPQYSAAENGLATAEGAFLYQLQTGPSDVLPSQVFSEAKDGRIEIQPFNIDQALRGSESTPEETSDGEADLSSTVAPAHCVDAALALQTNNELPEITGLALVILDGQIYELYQLADDNFVVFDQATCDRVD